MKTEVKICGLTTPAGVEAANEADYIGFVFHPGSPRNISPEQVTELVRYATKPTVAVVVNPTDYQLHAITQSFDPAFIQLHGRESPVRVMRIKQLFKTEIIKAFQVTTASDILNTDTYEEIAEVFMFDSNTGFGIPGGTGKTFDWNLLSDLSFRKPWFLSGGLNAENVEGAIKLTGAKMVDVSTGVESSPGVKDVKKIREFIKKAKRFEHETF